MTEYTEEVIVNLKDYVLNLAYSKEEIDNKLSGYVTKEEFESSVTCVLTATTDLINPNLSQGTALTASLSQSLKNIPIKFYTCDDKNPVILDSNYIDTAYTNENGQAIITVKPQKSTYYIAQAIISIGAKELELTPEKLEQLDDDSYINIENVGVIKKVNSNITSIQCATLKSYIQQSLAISGPSETEWGVKNNFVVSLIPIRENVLIKAHGEEHYTNESGEVSISVTPSTPGVFTIAASTNAQSGGQSSTNELEEIEYLAAKASKNLNVKKRAINFTLKTSKSKYLQIKVTDSQNKVVNGLSVTLSYPDKRPSITAKSNSDGYIYFYHNPVLKNGTYKFTLKSNTTTLYLADSATMNVKVTDDDVIDNDIKANNTGVYCWSQHFKSLTTPNNLKTLKKMNIYNIFAHEEVYSYLQTNEGKQRLTDIHNAGLKVQLWVNVFFDNNTGKWKPPKYRSGSSIKYSTHKSGGKYVSYITYKQKAIEKYVTIKDTKGRYIDGIFLDYFRYPGEPSGMKAVNIPGDKNATTVLKKYNGTQLITYFAQVANKIIAENDKAHNANQELGCHIMPEPSANISYYGQNVSALTQYMDYIVVGCYKGDYNGTNNWITSVIRSIKSSTSTNTTTSYRTKQHACHIWAGLQGYKNSNNITRKTIANMKKEAKAAIAGGATGIVWHRYTIMNFFNHSILNVKKE